MRRLTARYRLAKSVFSNPEDYLQFLDENGFHEQRIAALKELSRHEEAADTLLRLGRRLEAIDQFLLAQGRESQQKAAASLLELMFLHLSFGSPQKNASTELKELISISSRLDLTSSPAEQAEVCRNHTSYLAA